MGSKSPFLKVITAKTIISGYRASSDIRSIIKLAQVMEMSLKLSLNAEVLSVFIKGIAGFLIQMTIVEGILRQHGE